MFIISDFYKTLYILIAVGYDNLSYREPGPGLGGVSGMMSISSEADITMRSVNSISFSTSEWHNHAIKLKANTLKN